MQTSHLHSERRSAERFFVSLPVETDKGPGITRDVSVSGLYLVADQRLAGGDRLQLIVTLTDGDPSLPIRLSLKGRVIRVEDVDGAMGVGIALDEESMHLVQAS